MHDSMTTEADKQAIMQKLQAIDENTVTKKYIIPLLETLGFYKVEFYGGRDEHGKDILCWENDRFGETKLTVAQVKHFKFTNTASSPRSLQTIINQLINCFKDDMMAANQTTHLPHEAILITTHIVGTKTLQTRLSSNLTERRIKIIDGLELASLIMSKTPALAKELLGIQKQLSSSLRDTFNEVLMTALGSSDKKNLKHIYTDIDFSLGKTSTKLFFCARFNPRSTTIQKKNEADWQEFKALYAKCNTEFQIEFLNVSFEEVENGFKRQEDALDKWEQELNQLLEDGNTISHEADQRIKKARSSTTDYNQASIDELAKFYQQRRENHRAIINNYKRTKPSEPVYNVPVNGQKISELLVEKRRWIEQKITEFNEAPVSIEAMSAFVLECKKIIDAVAVFFSEDFAEAIGVGENAVIRRDFETTRFKLQIHRVLNTRHNLLLLGDAGAGKTTTLQMFGYESVLNGSNVPIFIALSILTQNWSSTHPELTDALKVEEFTEGISKYLTIKGVHVSASQLNTEFSTSAYTLLLDGLDEAIGNNPWLPEAISKLADHYKDNLQIIVSSRNLSAAYVDKIPFFAVTLLPFTIEQRNVFIGKWFAERDYNKVEAIQLHLKENTELAEVSNNPLLITTLCVLADKGITLPNSEVMLYDCRLKLLTGSYDTAKKLDKRCLTPQPLLERMAQKIAFLLHTLGERAENIENIVVQAKKFSICSEEDAELAIHELVDPCNLLVPMTEDGKYGFGHLRYQEHLAAREIMSNRSISIVKLLQQPWWRGVILLFAKMNNDLMWLVEEVGTQSNVKSYEPILTDMIKVSQVENPKNHLDRFRFYAKADGYLYDNDGCSDR